CGRQYNYDVYVMDFW
nr:immunoglobulin heavy chain junction region [Mus musculus]